MERKGIVTIHGNSLTLIGPELKVGDKAPEFTVLDSDLKEVKLQEFKGKIKVISVTCRPVDSTRRPPVLQKMSRFSTSAWTFLLRLLAFAMRPVLTR
jgi:hypothetical protein